MSVGLGLYGEFVVLDASTVPFGHEPLAPSETTQENMLA